MGNVNSMEDQQEATQERESGRDLGIEESEHVSIVIDESMGRSRIVEQVVSLKDASNENSVSATPKPRIQRVSSMLRNNEDFKKYFVPKVVAIGPLHRDNSELKAAENIKLIIAGAFIKKYGINIIRLYDKIIDDKETLRELRECYEDKEIEKYSHEELVGILLVDGCAVLHFIDRAVKNELTELVKELHITRHVLCTNEDIFLVENQLPYHVLEWLMSSSEREDDLQKAVAKFIYMNSMAPAEKWMKDVEKLNNSSNVPEIGGGRPQGIDTDMHRSTHHLLDLLRKNLLRQDSSNDAQINRKKWRQLKESENMCYDWRPFHTAKDLKAVGIKLKPSKSSSLQDISFSPGCFSGSLMLPPMVSDNSATFKFLNLVAFEMFPDYGNEFEVISYLAFMTSFIHHEEDVQEMRSAGIYYKRMGNDEEQRKLMYYLAANLIPNPEAYSGVKNNIQTYFASRRNAKIATWLADVKQDYFRNPWSAIAVIAAAFAILVSVVQTYYTIFPLPKNC